MSTDPAIYSAFTSGSAETPRPESILEILWRRKQSALIVFLLCVMAAAAAVQLVPKKLTAQTLVLVTPTPSAADNRGGDATTLLNTQCELIRSAAVLSQAMGAPGMNDLNFFENTDNRIEFLRDRLDVRPVPSTWLIAVRVASTKPEEAKTIVDAVAQAYVEYVAEQQHRNTSVELYTKIAEDRNGLDEKRSDAKKHLLNLQAEAKALGNDAGGGATTAPATDNVPADNIAGQKLRQMQDALTDAQLNTLKLKTQYEASLQPLGMSMEKVDADRFADATAVSPQNLPVLAANLSALSQQLVEAKRQFVPTHPAVRTIRKQIADLQLTQAATLKTAYEAAISHERDTRDLYVNQQQVSQNFNAKANELAMTADRVNVLEHEITVLDAKLQALQTSESLGYDVRQFDDAAIDPKSATPNALKTIGFAAIIGLVLGLMISLAREWVSPSLGAPQHIADRVGVPVLGTLPRIAGRPGRDMARVASDAADGEAAEAFRSIRTSFLFGGGPNRTIAITSPAGRDGKSTLAANLAISLAQSGKRVLLIDANFRDPFLHTVFEMDNVIGLTSVLDGDDLESSIRHTAIDQLDILTAGPTSADASERLNSTLFLDTCHDLAMRYDHVVFDTPSVAGGNDARIIASGCDQTLLVVRGERSNRFATTAARDALLSVGAQIIGIVMNDWQRLGQTHLAGGDRGGSASVDRVSRGAKARDGR